MSTVSSFLGRGDDPHLRRLEHQLDRAVVRSALRVANGWRSRWPKFAGRPEAFSFSPLLAASDSRPLALAAALSRALQAGALESAKELTRRVEPALEGLPVPLRNRAREECIETCIACGDLPHGERLALTALPALRDSATGCALLELLGLGEGKVALPDGRCNALALSRGIASNKVDAGALASAFDWDARRWLSNPELMLLFWSALRFEDPPRALAWLNRFLRGQGLSTYRWSSGACAMNNPLEGLAPVKSGRRREGPLVSVLMPVRNAVSTLDYALRSLRDQTYQALEILVCDDASDDDSALLMRELARRDDRVRLFRSSDNQGAYNIRNELALRARGELLACHDADDLAMPSRIAQQVALLRRTRASACVGSWLRLDERGRVVFFKNQRATRMALATAMFTRGAFQRVGPFRPARVGADWELFTDLCASGPRAVVRLRAPLTLGWWQPASATRAPGTEALENGYRSPLRRAYGELVHAKHADGPRPTDAEIDEQLRAHGNYAAPAEIIELAQSR